MKEKNNIKEIKEIENLSCLYASLIDSKQFNRLNEVFSKDAILKIPEFQFDGVESIISCMEALREYDKTQHFVTNQLVNIDNLTATNEVYTVASHLSKIEAICNKLDWGIIYKDKLKKEQGYWKICRRELNLLWEKNSTVKY
tara:strand:+ start:610 stop:1035 length:426 start_codon:yes stop_codon:yes gene_type:complete